MTEALRIGVFGKGRLGSAIATAAGDELAWQVSREPPPEVQVDVAIEASAAPAVPGRLDWALARGTPLVIGTTGWPSEGLAQRIDDRIGVVLAPNFSLGVALLRRLALVLARFCALDERRDPYLLEHHHARKHDAPSGTALWLARALMDGCPRKTGWALGGPLAPEQLAVGVLRAGATYSSHTVGMDAPAETIELHHTARSPAVFADGALAAARWVKGRRGVFTMDAVAAAALEPLFDGPFGRPP